MRPSPLLAIFLIVAVDVLGLTIMIPLLPFYAEKLGATPFQVGWLIGAYAACQLISGPLLGRLSDSTGRKPLLLVSQAGTFIGFIVTAFAPNLVVLFLARMIDGATAGNLSLAQAYISDITKPEDRAKSFGVIGIAFGDRILDRPCSVGDFGEVRLPVSGLYGGGIVGVEHSCNLGPIAEGGAGEKRCQPAAIADRMGRIREIFSRSAVGDAAVAIPVLYFWLLDVHFRVPFVCRKKAVVGAGADRVCLRLGGIPGYFNARARVRRSGEKIRREGVEPRWIFGVRGQISLLGLTHSIPMLVLAATVTAFGGFIRPTLTSLITKAAPRSEQGSVLGLQQSLTSVAQIAAPPFAGI